MDEQDLSAVACVVAGCNEAAEGEGISKGRVMKVEIGRNQHAGCLEIDVRLYDRDNGVSAGRRALLGVCDD